MVHPATTLRNVQLELPGGNQVNVTLSLTNSGTTTTSAGMNNSYGYDSYGAMLFIVITICVYSAGIGLFIARHMYSSRTEAKHQDVQVSDFLLSALQNRLEREKRMHCVNLMKQVSLQVTIEQERDEIDDNIIIEEELTISDENSEPGMELKDCQGRLLQHADDSAGFTDINIVNINEAVEQNDLGKEMEESV